jgi:hypothetical protein
MRQLAVLLQHLRRVAPRAAVDPIELLTATLRAIVVTTAAATTVVIVVHITIVIQGYRSSKPRALSEPIKEFATPNVRAITVCFSRAVIPTFAVPQLPRHDHMQMLELNQVWEINVHRPVRCRT